MNSSNDVAVQLPPRPVSAAIARNMVECTARQLNCMTDADIDDLCVAVGEAFANVVLHGATVDGEPVCVRVFRLEDRLTVHIDYQSEPFDPSPRLPRPDDMAPGGYGLYIMQTLTDAVDFQFYDGRAHVRLEKVCQPLHPDA